MHEEFHRKSGVKIIRDAHRIPCDLICEKHCESKAGTAQLAAKEFLDKFGELLDLKPKQLHNLSLPPEALPIDARVEYRFLGEKPQFDTIALAYCQTYFGLPVWQSGLAVYMKQAPFRFFGAQAARDPKIRATEPSARSVARLRKLDANGLGKLLGLAHTGQEFDINSLRILHHRLMIYRYEACKRVVAQHETRYLRPRLDRSIVDGRHYVVAALDFRLDWRPFRQKLHWVALVEAETQSILYLRALIDHVCGLVFQADPMTLAGGPFATADNRKLNSLRGPVTLQGLKGPDKAGLSSLSGEIIKIRDFEPPQSRPPKVRTGETFDYQARTNEFAAVSSYYHCDRFFRLVEDLGFPRAKYFKATSFPLPVDHRGQPNPERQGIEINARCQGNTTVEGGLLNVRFALADVSDLGNPLGNASDWRIVLHELGGHATLWNHINFGHFGFAHSAGDSFAAILNDPDSHLRDDDQWRFVTFPWIKQIDRRHDRKVAEGWGWAGTNDLGVNPDRPLDPAGYHSEQILSTTQFRIYRAIGGDSEQPNMRRFAARFVAYLILRAIGSFFPATNPGNAAQYATALINADAGDWTTEGHAGGAYGKVIRWAFEKQGMYQPAGGPRPVATEGNPPPVDVYIEDGRKGEYQYQANYWSCEAIWNRLADDGGTPHQEPVAGITNFAYVKINNRGSEPATRVTVRAFHCRPSAGQMFPDDWQPMTTAKLRAHNVPPNSEITVGPFAWEPSRPGDQCMLMVVSAHGDASNVDNCEEGKSIPAWRLVPHDNNIALRSVFPVNASGVKTLVAAFDLPRIYVKNPHARRARMVVNPVLPVLLAEAGWHFEFTDPDGHTFPLEPYAGREVIMRLKTGNRFTAEEVREAGNPCIHVEVYGDEVLVGGMSYRLDPDMKALSKPKRSRT